MSLQSIQETCNLVDERLVANSHHLGPTVTALLPDALARGMRELRRFGDQQHQTVYAHGPSPYRAVPCSEMEIWHVSLMLAEYLADLLGRKVKEGHCNASDHAPCATMRAEHLRMFQQYRKALEGLLDDVKALEATL